MLTNGREGLALRDRVNVVWENKRALVKFSANQPHSILDSRARI